MKKTCDHCAYWQPAPTQVPGCEREKICGFSKQMGYGLSGQDGRAIITPAHFGCIEWAEKSPPATPAEAADIIYRTSKRGGWNK